MKQMVVTQSQFWVVKHFDFSVLDGSQYFRLYVSRCIALTMQLPSSLPSMPPELFDKVSVVGAAILKIVHFHQHFILQSPLLCEPMQQRETFWEV